MSPIITVLLVSWLAGFAAFIGGTISSFEGTKETRFKQEMIHGMVALGGGILIAAVAFALTPEGLAELTPTLFAFSFVTGGIGFCLLDIYLKRSGGSKAQFMAMLVDFLPEAISLGAVFGENRKLGYLLAAFIGAQNLPEGFNSFRELKSAGTTKKKALSLLFLVGFIGPAAALIGYLFFNDKKMITASLMSFASGGILYLIFQDIAPQARLKRHWAPPMGAVLGFLIGALGKQLMG